MFASHAAYFFETLEGRLLAFASCTAKASEAASKYIKQGWVQVQLYLSTNFVYLYLYLSTSKVLEPNPDIE